MDICCHSDSSERQSTNVGVKNSQNKRNQIEKQVFGSSKKAKKAEGLWVVIKLSNIVWILSFIFYFVLTNWLIFEILKRCCLHTNISTLAENITRVLRFQDSSDI